MARSLSKIWVHAIWSTADGRPLLRDTVRPMIIDRLYRAFQEHDCRVRIVNGPDDHLHALFQLCPRISLAGVMEMVKGESAQWINEQGFFRMGFAWQTGYGGFSVSASMVRRVEEYIRHQEERHQKVSFQEEFDGFLKKYGILVNR
jgi:putative transposase